MLNETWTLSTDVLDIPDFYMVGSVDCTWSRRKLIGTRRYVSQSIIRQQITLSKLFVFRINNSSVSIATVNINQYIICSIYVSTNASTNSDNLLEALQYIFQKECIYRNAAKVRMSECISL